MNSTNLNKPPRDPAERALRYIEAALKRNPVSDSQEILEIRDRFLGIRRAAGTGGRQVDTDELRRGQMLVLERIRKQFWASDLKTIRTELAELDSTQFPDVRLAVRRLRTVAEHRHLFPELAEAGSRIPQVFKAFRDVLASSPTDAAEIRQTATFGIRNPKGVRALVKQIRKKMPEVYELEADWMAMLLRVKPMRTVAEEESRFSRTLESINYGWLIRILIFLAIVLLKILSRT